MNGLKAKQRLKQSPVTNQSPLKNLLSGILHLKVPFYKLFFFQGKKETFILSLRKKELKMQTGRDWFESVSRTTRLTCLVKINKPFPRCPYLAGHPLKVQGYASVSTDSRTKHYRKEEGKKKRTYNDLKATNRFCIMSLAWTLQAYIPQRCLCGDRDSKFLCGFQ